MSFERSACFTYMWWDGKGDSRRVRFSDYGGVIFPPLREWLCRHFGKDGLEEWHYELFCRSSWPDSREAFSRALLRKDAAPFVELLFPRHPELFAARLKLNFSGGVTLEGDFLSLCAAAGATGCLHALLEGGANPDGNMDPADWSVLRTHDGGAARPVSPLDCARFTGQKGCALLLERYGGKRLLDRLGLPVPETFTEPALWEDAPKEISW